MTWSGGAASRTWRTRERGKLRAARARRAVARSLVLAVALGAVVLLPTLDARPAAAASCRPGTLDLDLDGRADSVVGVPGADSAGAVDSGAVAVLRGSGGRPVGNGGFTLTQSHLGDDVVARDGFGSSLAIGDVTGDGCLDLAVGAPGEDGGRGAVYVIDLSTAARPSPRAVRLVQDGSGSAGGPEAGDRFGATLAVTPGARHATLWVGAPGEDIGSAADAGAVTSFGRSDVRGEELAGDRRDWLQGDFGGRTEARDGFGAAVAGGATVIAVGAPGEDLGSVADAGVVNYRTRTGTARQLGQDSAGVPDSAEPGDRFGASVAVARGCRSTGEALVTGSPAEDLGSRADAGRVTLTQLAAPGTSIVVDQGSSRVAGSYETGDRFGAALVGTKAGFVAGVPGEDAASAVDGGYVEDIHIACSSSGRPSVSSGRGFSQATDGVAGANESGDQMGASLAVVAGTPTSAGTATAVLTGLPGEDVSAARDAGSALLLPLSGTATVTASGSVGLSRGSGADGSPRAGEHLASALPVAAGGRAGSIPVTGPFRETAPVTPTPTPLPRGATFPAGVSGDGRYFVDASGQPWFGVGDTAWSLVAQLSPAEIDTYLEDRARRGVNLVLANVLEHAFSDNAPNNYADQPPFVGATFRSSPNPAYWAVVDHAVAKAQSLGITLLLCPAYLGFPGTDEGWASEVTAASNAALAAYGRFLAGRYGGADNVMWLIGHDRVPSAAEKARMEALAAALPAVDLVGLGGAPGWLGSASWRPTAAAADFDTVYTYESAADLTRSGWVATPLRPLLFLEGRYEQESDYALGDRRLRNQLYGPFLAGASGALFGNNPIWHFGSGASWPYTGTWQQNLDSPGGRDLGVFGDLVRSTPWASMSPVAAGTLLRAGAGSGEATAIVRLSSTHALVYLPTSRAVTVALERLTGATDVRVRAVDPRSGRQTDMGSTATSGNLSIPALGGNAAGDGDWLLEIMPAA